MATRKLSRKSVVELMVLIAIAAVCLYFMILMLFNAHPHITPGVKTGGGHTSTLQVPAGRLTGRGELARG